MRYLNGVKIRVKTLVFACILTEKIKQFGIEGVVNYVKVSS